MATKDEMPWHQHTVVKLTVHFCTDLIDLPVFCSFSAPHPPFFVLHCDTGPLFHKLFFFSFFALSASAYGWGEPLGRLQDLGEEGKAFSSAFCLGLGFAFACNDRRAVVGGWSPRHPYGPINTPAMGGVFL